MLKDFPLYTTIRVTDLDKALDFYGNKLGLKKIEMKTPEDALMFEAGGGTKIYLYKGPLSKSEHTLAGFDVKDIETVMDDLERKGVVFEKYDMPDLKTDEKGLAKWGDVKSAWFKDPDGHILAINEM